ncbi:hypothetical protein OG792_04380 [Micromonospora sp. NBC_01699]|uniref:hypothetical protein n=1 Tax=Micromonospora sp. NBC_01699 TaxID=2975984 RepID=UPI002E373CD2|nr:hypothetical protein [Micromonospora sp. NBC_01699]
MLVRRGAVRFATVCALLAGLVTVGAAPAFADDEDSVRLGSPGSFTAGGSAGSVTVAVTKRSRGCVSARTALLIQLPGLSAGDVDLLVARDGRWVPVPVSAAGDGLLRSGRVAPEKPELCERKSVSVRYRLAFAAGTPAGRLNLVAEAYTAGGDLIARAAEARKVNGAKGTPTPSSRTSKSASPTPTPEETTFAPEPEPTEVVAVVPTGQPGLGAGAGDGGGGGVGSMVMVVGVGMVAIGIALLVLLLRRSRGGRDERDAGGTPGAGPRPPFPPPAGAGGDATVVMPRIRP